jgi:hypothetical protein
MGDNSFIMDLILTIFIEMKYKFSHDVKLTKRQVQKILFALKMELINEIGDELPFYWYNHGPFSELVAGDLDGLVGKFLSTEPKNGYNLYVMKSELTNTLVDDYIVDSIVNIVKKANPFNFNPFISYIYNEFAPFDFMPNFKIEFLNAFTEYNKHISNGQTLLDVYLENPVTSKDLLEICYDCEAKLPFDPLFKDFNESFSRFLSVFETIYENEPDNEVLFFKTYELADEIIWNTFSGGVRILQEGHDDYYEDKLDNWKYDFQNSLSNMKIKIKDFSYNDFKFTSDDNYELSETSRKLLNATIGSYIK